MKIFLWRICKSDFNAQGVRDIPQVVDVELPDSIIAMLPPPPPGYSNPHWITSYAGPTSPRDYHGVRERTG